MHTETNAELVDFLKVALEQEQHSIVGFKVEALIGLELGFYGSMPEIFSEKETECQKLFLQELYDRSLVSQFYAQVEKSFPILKEKYLSNDMIQKELETSTSFRNDVLLSAWTGSIKDEHGNLYPEIKATALLTPPYMANQLFYFYRKLDDYDALTGRSLVRTGLPLINRQDITKYIGTDTQKLEIILYCICARKLLQEYLAQNTRNV